MIQFNPNNLVRGRTYDFEDGRYTTYSGYTFLYRSGDVAVFKLRRGSNNLTVNIFNLHNIKEVENV
jgi:hypothetical protein